MSKEQELINLGFDINAPDFMQRALMASLSGAWLKALGIDKDTLQYGLGIAKAYLMKGEKEEALRTYAYMVMLDPLNLDFQFGLANCALAMEHYPMASQAASAIISIDPTHARAYYVSGRCSFALGNKEEALEDLRKAVEFGKQAKDDIIVKEAGRWLHFLEVAATDIPNDPET